MRLSGVDGAIAVGGETLGVPGQLSGIVVVQLTALVGGEMSGESLQGVVIVVVLLHLGRRRWSISVGADDAAALLGVVLSADGTFHHEPSLGGALKVAEGLVGVAAELESVGGVRAVGVGTAGLERDLHDVARLRQEEMEAGSRGGERPLQHIHDFLSPANLTLSPTILTLSATNLTLSPSQLLPSASKLSSISSDSASLTADLRPARRGRLQRLSNAGEEVGDLLGGRKEVLGGLRLVESGSVGGGLGVHDAYDDGVASGRRRSGGGSAGEGDGFGQASGRTTDDADWLGQLWLWLGWWIA